LFVLNFDDSEIENPGRAKESQLLPSSSSLKDTKESKASIAQKEALIKSVDTKKASLKALMSAGP
jgi:hypothetical protein